MVGDEPAGMLVYVGTYTTRETFVDSGHDSIAVFAVDGDTGRLSPVGHTATDGRTPRNFAIDPTGVWLFAANQDSDSIVPFRIDPANGRLERAGPVVGVPTPVCVRIMPRPARR